MAFAVSTIFPEFNLFVHFLAVELVWSKFLRLFDSAHGAVFESGPAQTILKLFLLPEKLKLSTRAVLWVLALEHVTSFGIDMAA